MGLSVGSRPQKKTRGSLYVGSRRSPEELTGNTRSILAFFFVKKCDFEKK